MKSLAPTTIARLAQRLAVVTAVFLCSAMSASAWADPPGRVGRVDDMSGQVWLYSPDAGEWISAVRNRPLTTGDRLATDADARVELRIGSSAVRLDAGTELEVLAIDDDHISLQLHNGSVMVRIRTSDSANEFELKTAEGRFLTDRPGRYRFDRGDDASNVTVWSGEARYEGPGSGLTVGNGQRAEFWLDRNSAAQYSITEPVQDDFTNWSNERDRREERSASTRYVSPEMTGVEDLDRYGRWQDAPDYGAVWIPSQVPVGWAPYTTGHWAWVSPWGWTWVDDAPWGFAPFHYGRWAMLHDRWCWVPGTYVNRPVYAPALVGWVGGSNFSLSISVGGGRAPAVGWFPLAPREVFVPTYHVSPRYVQQVNITHVTNITNITTIVNNPQQAVANVDYRNRRIPHALTVVPQSVMVNRQPVAPAAAQLRNTTAVQQLASQPVQNVVVSAPHVAAPAVTPAVAQARHIPLQDLRETQTRAGAEGGRAPAIVSTVHPPATTVVVPPSPVHPAVAARPSDPEQRARLMQERERRQQEAPARPDSRAQGNVPAAKPAPQAVPPAVRAAEEGRVQAAPAAAARVPPPPTRDATAQRDAAAQREAAAREAAARRDSQREAAQREAQRESQREAQERARAVQGAARPQAESVPEPPHRTPQAAAEQRPSAQPQRAAPQEAPPPNAHREAPPQRASAPSGREEPQQARQREEQERAARERKDQRER